MSESGGDSGEKSFETAGGQLSRYRLTTDQLAALRAYGRESEVEAGTILFAAGDDDADLIVVLAGELDLFDPGERGDARAMLSLGPGQFTGELGLLSGKRVTVTAVMRTAGVIVRVPSDRVRAVVADERDLSQVLLDAFVARRQTLLDLGVGLTLIGSRHDLSTRRLLEMLARNNLPCQWLDPESSAEGLRLLAELDASSHDLPLVVVGGGPVLRNPSDRVLGGALGISALDGSSASADCDVLIVGGGPGGLAAAVYGASEGLTTILVEGTALGGQAGTSSRIENYLGFPAGLSGAELSARAVVQAKKFGAHIRLLRAAVALTAAGDRHVVTLDDGQTVTARAVVIATGAKYRRLPLDRLRDYEGVGVYYAATAIEARTCLQREVAIVGGGNSAGQAALYLARSCARVYLIVRRPELQATMSRYLVERIERDPAIELLPSSQVRRLLGDDSLDGVEVTRDDGRSARLAVRALFLFIGASPCTDWLGDQIALDDRGFVLTGADVPRRWLGQAIPLSLETSRRGVFCVGDARSGSIKRAATAIGEGSMVVRLIFDRLQATGQLGAAGLSATGS